ncbi:hypothetical protein ON010_g11773 [Phytophthora cinnamomi]|nr:hypothetical protein ON010_g11773 [Phytophthora cinnamomi]
MLGRIFDHFQIWVGTTATSTLISPPPCPGALVAVSPSTASCPHLNFPLPTSALRRSPRSQGLPPPVVSPDAQAASMVELLQSPMGPTASQEDAHVPGMETCQAEPPEPDSGLGAPRR